MPLKCLCLRSSLSKPKWAYCPRACIRRYAREAHPLPRKRRADLLSPKGRKVVIEGSSHIAIANLDEKKYTELDQSTKVCNFSTLCYQLSSLMICRVRDHFEKRPKSYIRYQQRCPRSVLSNRSNPMAFFLSTKILPLPIKSPFFPFIHSSCTEKSQRCLLCRRAFCPHIQDYSLAYL